MDRPRRLEHGTPEGYDAGCRKDKQCPALYVHGMSCFTAHLRFVSVEHRYMGLRARGLTSTQIAQRLGFLPEPRPINDTDVRSIMTDTPKPIPATAAAAISKAKAAAEQRRTAPAEPAPPAKRKAAKPKTPGAVDRAERAKIRDWAHDVGVPCPDYGKIPARVVAAYEAGDPSLGMPAPVDPARLDRAEQTAADLEQIRKVEVGADEMPDNGWGAAEWIRGGSPDPASSHEFTPDDEGNCWVCGHAAHYSTEPAQLRPETFAEELDQVRDRIDMPRPQEPVDADVEADRPEWAKVAVSVDVERARSLTARMWDELELTEQRATRAEAALELALRKWAAATDSLATSQRAIGTLLERLTIAELRADIAQDRAARAEREVGRAHVEIDQLYAHQHATYQPRHAAHTPGILTRTRAALAASLKGHRA